MHLNERARKWLPWLLLAAAVVAAAAVYWPGLAGGWVFDDYPNIVDNTAIHITPGHSTLAAWVNSALSSPASFLHRPLASLTFSLNWYFGGGDPWPFKLTNIIIHLVNGVLVFFMVRALLRLVMWRAGIPPMLRISAARSALRPEGGDNPPPSAGWAERTRTRAKRGGGGGFPAREGTPTLLHDDDIPPRLRRDPLRTEGGDHGLPLPQEGGMRGMCFPAIDESAATRLALIVSAGWMLLPINLMAVLYVVQRMESLCQVFVLAGLWAYLHGRWMMLTADDAHRDRHGFALAVGGIVLGTCLGLTSKETAVLLPLFAFLAEWIVLRFARASTSPRAFGATPFASEGGEKNPPPSAGRAERMRTRAQRGEGDGKHDQRIWWLFVFTLFIPAVLGFAWLLRGVLRPGALAGRDFTLAQRLLTEPRVLVDYLHWTLFPNPMVLSLYHDEIVKSTGLLAPWTTLGSIALLAALIVIAVWLRNRRPLVSLGIGWFFAAQLLTATIIPLELVYEQRMYFASIGVLLAAGALLLGLRWRIRLPLLRGFIVAVALLWFAVATNLRAQEWSNPIRLAVAEANRHPESPRAVYEAGRLLLIASNYQPGKALDASWIYLRRAAAIPGSSALSDQAMIMIADHERQGEDRAYWDSMIRKLRDQPTRQEDISALVSLTNCYGAGICKFDVAYLQRAYEAALSRPHPIARLDGAYAAFQRDILHNDKLAEAWLERAVAGAPGETAYRIDLAALYARHGETEKALEQIDALRRMNYAGRLDGQIATLEKLAEQGKVPAPSAN